MYNKTVFVQVTAGNPSHVLLTSRSRVHAVVFAHVANINQIVLGTFMDKAMNELNTKKVYYNIVFFFFFIISQHCSQVLSLRYEVSFFLEVQNRSIQAEIIFVVNTFLIYRYKQDFSLSRYLSLINYK